MNTLMRQDYNFMKHLINNVIQSVFAKRNRKKKSKSSKPIPTPRACLGNKTNHINKQKKKSKPDSTKHPDQGQPTNRKIIKMDNQSRDAKRVILYNN